MARMSVENIMKRSSLASSRKDEWRTIYQECYEYALPQRNLYDGYYDGKVGGAKKMNRVFDATAINSTQRFANRLQSGIFPPQRKWCRLETGPDIPEDRTAEASAALDIYADKSKDKIRGISYTPDFVSHDADGKLLWVIECKGFANDRFPNTWKNFKKHLIDTDSVCPLFLPKDQKQVLQVIQLISEL